MKWLRHPSDLSQNDPVASRVLQDQGVEGYGRLNLLYELITAAMDDEKSAPVVERSEQEFTNILRCKRKGLTRFLEYLQKISEIKVVRSGNRIRVEIPNVSNLLSNRAVSSSRRGAAGVPREEETREERVGNLPFLPHAFDKGKKAVPSSLQDDPEEPLTFRIRESLRGIDRPNRSDQAAEAFGRLVFGDIRGIGAIIPIQKLDREIRSAIDEALVWWTKKDVAFFDRTKWTKESWERAHTEALDQFVRNRLAIYDRASIPDANELATNDPDQMHANEIHGLLAELEKESSSANH